MITVYERIVTSLCVNIMEERIMTTLYERLGGVYAIANIIDRFSDDVLRSPLVGQASPNPALRAWSTNSLGRLPGLKFMRTLWVCDITGGPFKFQATKPGATPLGLEEVHHDLQISPEEFDEVAIILAHCIDSAGVPSADRNEVLAAFSAHKAEVTAAKTVESTPVVKDEPEAKPVAKTIET